MQPPYAPSENVSRLRESATIAVSQHAKALRAQGRSIIDLGAGEPDFETPAYIRRAAQDALDQGATRYTAVEGILPLRQLIAARATECASGPAPVEPTEVVVTTGSKQALFNACYSLFGPGDEVLIPTPAWTSYYEMVSLARATAVPVPGDPGSGFKIGAADLKRRATAHTRGVFINSPCNPTGSVYSSAEIEAVVRLAEARGWWLISDEIYRRIAYVPDVPSVLSVARSRERLVVVDGMAKAYAMTGWRVGWAVAPRGLARTMTALQSHTTSNATTVAQHAALAALGRRAEAEAAIASMVAEFRRRRDAALAVLNAVPGLRVVRPDGAFYLFVDVSATVANGRDAGAAFAARLLDEHGVAVVPGAAFQTPGWVRASYAAAEADVVEGVQRLAALWQAMRREVAPSPA